MAECLVVDVDEFWAVVESARADRKPTADALVDRLAVRSRDEILSFQERFDEAETIVHRWDVWAAAYLIGGGCSDDSFTDFRAGLIALGRDWFEKVARSPDELAGHPLVVQAAQAAADGDDYVIFYEEFGNAAARAYERLSGGDPDAFYTACKGRWDAEVAQGDAAHDMGEDVDFDDRAEMSRRLPRLTAMLFPED